MNESRGVLLAMTGALAMVFVDQTVVSVALPDLRADLGASRTEAAWMVAAYNLAIASLVMASGRAGDLIGSRRAFLTGLAVFAGSSALCGLAQSPGWAIGARALQGTGAAIMMPTSTAILADTFPAARRGHAIGVQFGVASLFLVLGPTLGGLITETLGWRWVFWINIPLGAAVALVAARAVPGGMRRATLDQIDLRGLVTSAAGLAAVVLALMQGADWGWASATTLGLLVGGASLLTLFVARERRAPHPLIGLSLFRDPEYVSAAVVALALRFGVVGAVVYSALFLQEGMGFTPLQAGLALMPATLATAVFSPVGSRLVDRYGPRLPIVLGMMVFGGALVWIAALASQRQYWLLIPGLLGYGIGSGFGATTTMTAAMSAAGRGERGSAAGVVSVWRQVGGTLGVSVMAAVVAARAGEGFVSAVAAAFGVAAQSRWRRRSRRGCCCDGPRRKRALKPLRRDRTPPHECAPAHPQARPWRRARHRSLGCRDRLSQGPLPRSRLDPGGQRGRHAPLAGRRARR
jgi:EmrB/QacA subfamily drug resistance transporter